MFLFIDYINRLHNRLAAKALTESVQSLVSKDLAYRTAEKLGLDFSKEKFSFNSFWKGMRVEMEHKDVTKGDPIMTAKIALAHLHEKPDYYELLAKMEKK